VAITRQNIIVTCAGEILLGFLSVLLTLQG